jgi:membrane protein implicated in regulation of membrane protease activity
MKLKPLKIGQVIITPKMLIALIGAIFILGIGIGVTLVSKDNSKFALFICIIISVAIVVYTFSKGKKTEQKRTQNKANI